ncbi:site-specific DNA-methyltransferase [Piscinibacterium candidicorallinum]|uniref:site-specific DNA-methyltransferase (adenine-specific) n=1 Tax=Piscinibacterium candidicorallinum TaxID=1793872 RepID=A0ABV7H4T9_9BURK
MATKKNTPLSVETLKHGDATRRNIPTAEYQSVMAKEEQSPVRVAYERRNRDLDPQLVWRGKDQQDWSDLVVHAPPLYIQEKVHPKVLVDELRRETDRRREEKTPKAEQVDLFADFNGLPGEDARTEFYQHDGHWSNRMILGDSLQVMASLAEREGLRGKVQCIFLDPPYGIKFNSNFQWSTTSRDVKDGSADHITREPEQVKAFRDTWRDGINSYLSYLRDRLTVARDLLHDSGSVFVQISDENVHRVRSLLDEVFGEDNYCGEIAFSKTTGLTSRLIASTFDYLIWYSKRRDQTKYRPLYSPKPLKEEVRGEFRWYDDPAKGVRGLTTTELEEPERIDKARLFRTNSAVSPGVRANTTGSFVFQGLRFDSGAQRNWKTTLEGMERLCKADRIILSPGSVRIYKQRWADFDQLPLNNFWLDVRSEQSKLYVVQTVEKVIQRCILMTTDPGDLVLDPTCGSGTTAYVAEQWGRRWITIDTSRVALALARARIMGARYPYYLLADSRDGQLKEAEITRTVPSSALTNGNVRQGFVYERVPHITLKSIANNVEIDVIWDKYLQLLEPLRGALNKCLGQQWQEWQVPREADAKWSEQGRELHSRWWSLRIERQREIDASITAKAEFEYLYDRPYEDRKKVRVAGPFTVESLSPHRVLTVDENDELVDSLTESEAEREAGRDFALIILENLRTSGVQQAHKADRIEFTSLVPWPGELVCAEGRYVESDAERRAAIFIGPEFGTVSRPDLVAAAREAGDAGFDVLIACAFNYDAHSAEFAKLGRVPVLKARMNADLHMAEDLKNTGKGNLFVIFGEPDIEILDAGGGQVQVKVNGVDVFHPGTGEVRSDGADGIACWFVDTDYNEESFFVRHAYFLGAGDPYKALKMTLKAEIDPDVWATLNSDTSRPFPKPGSGRIAVKVINHLGDEVMKVFRVQ